MRVNARLWEFSPPVGLKERHFMPLNLALAEQVSQAESFDLARAFKVRAKSDQMVHEAKHIRVLLQERPVEPAQRIVLAIGVVVGQLRAAQFVADLWLEVSIFRHFFRPR
jgi:hypothetical protein